MSGSLRNLMNGMPHLLDAFPGKSHPTFVKQRLGNLGLSDGTSCLTEEQFTVILDAKLTGQAKGKVIASAGPEIGEASRKSFDAARSEDFDGAVLCLTRCSGIGISLASAILSWAFCNRTFAVIDRHGWRAYCALLSPEEAQNPFGKTAAFSLQQYRRYISGLHTFLNNEGRNLVGPWSRPLTISAVDYWLFAYSKAFGMGKLGAQSWHCWAAQKSSTWKASNA